MAGPLDLPLPDLPGDLSAVAATLRSRAAVLDLEGEHVRGGLAAPGWAGEAERAWSARARDRLDELERCAALHRAAAVVLDRHVEDLRRLRASLLAARELVEGAVRGVA
ncbi:hypothetical protein [Nocardioides bruguierae]|uniref:Uncharacterized protein n=1 Tax=Nocardioides bruguierae TaxID=2945102 RepID=A0A9X2D7M5_9ACTN|nr:hypothetical protein [Nocardioides bruguierae]MCM0620671.1 hypothetical protein [Nocardioides bruguierae]